MTTLTQHKETYQSTGCQYLTDSTVRMLPRSEARQCFFGGKIIIMRPLRRYPRSCLPENAAAAATTRTPAPPNVTHLHPPRHPPKPFFGAVERRKKKQPRKVWFWWQTDPEPSRFFSPLVGSIEINAFKTASQWLKDINYRNKKEDSNALLKWPPFLCLV